MLDYGRDQEMLMPIEPYQTHHPQIASDTFVHHTACLIGQVTVANDSSIWPYCVLRGDVEAIYIGAHTNIQDGTIIHTTHAGPYTDSGRSTHVGDQVTVGHRCILHACTIEDRAFIGMNSTILDGAIIRSGAMIGANSLITSGQDIDGGYLWLGQPARKVRPLTQAEQDYIAYSAAHYCRVAQSYHR
jgi:carbonic anhydrase/acetyltransferase-like protein (isoleucine patch superfamily)